MAKVLTSISFDLPAAPVTASVNDTFTFAGSPGFTGTGGTQRYDFKWEVDAGGGYVTIAAATGLTTAATNPVVNTNSTAQQSITVTCAEAGSYTIRMVGAPTSGGSYTVLSTTQTVEVSAPSHTGTGAISVPAATVAGSGSLGLTATGAVTVPAATISGTGTHSTGPTPVTGTGAITVPAATVAGAGAELFTATGAVSVPASTVSGTGTHVLTLTGTGAITAPAPTVVGSGIKVGGVDPGGAGHGLAAAVSQTPVAHGVAAILSSPDDAEDLIASGVL